MKMENWNSLPSAQVFKMLLPKLFRLLFYHDAMWKCRTDSERLYHQAYEVLTLSVAEAACERTFSTLDYTGNGLRSEPNDRHLHSRRDRYRARRLGRSPLLKPTTGTFFTMILYNSENSIRDKKPFDVHCFVTAGLWSILHVSWSSELVMRLDCQTLLKPPP